MIAPYYIMKSARYTYGMTQAEAAKAIGISTTAYRRAEAGEPIRVGTYEKISDFYRIRR